MRALCTKGRSSLLLDGKLHRPKKPEILRAVSLLYVAWNILYWSLAHRLFHYLSYGASQYDVRILQSNSYYIPIFRDLILHASYALLKHQVNSFQLDSHGDGRGT
jgi:hypothetical protein